MFLILHVVCCYKLIITIVYTYWFDTRDSLHGLLNCEIGGSDCHVITTEYKTRVHCKRCTNKNVFKIYNTIIWRAVFDSVRKIMSKIDIW